MPEQEHMRPVQLPAHPSILSSFLLFSLCCGRGLLALSEVALPGPTAVSSPSLPFWLGSSGVQTTDTQEQISSDLSCVPACKSNSTPGKGMQFHMPFAVETAGEALRGGRCWWGLLLLGARGAKLKTTAGRARASSARVRHSPTTAGQSHSSEAGSG